MCANYPLLLTNLFSLPECLGTIFSLLYTDVISMESYLEWKVSKERSKGKAMALMSTKNFFIWLESSSSEESS